MIGDQPTGTIDSVCIQAVAHEGLTATHNGRPAQLAIITADGQVIAAGKDVAREAMAVAINCHRNFLKGQGHLRVLSNPLTTTERRVA